MGAGDKEFEEEKPSGPYVIDASALYPLLLRLDSSEFVKFLQRFRILDLTKYEVGNAARYDSKLGNAVALMDLWKEILDSIEEGKITSLAEVQKIATENSITFYDAAYVQVAVNLESRVVTMDREILKKFKDRAISLDEFEEGLKERKKSNT